MATTPKTKAKPAKTVKRLAAKKVAAPPRGKGRPSKQTPEIEDEICERIANGESLVTICKSGLIGHTTVNNWLDKSENFRDKYARAREKQADFYAESIIAISDELEVKTKIDGEDVVLALDAAAINRNRLRVDARKWYASKLVPKKYGDRLETDVKVKVDIGDIDDKITSLLSKIAGGGRASRR